MNNLGPKAINDDDGHAYGTRHGVLITWLTTEPNQLWIYSGDVAASYVEPDANGGWTKTEVRRDQVPPAITDLWRG
ncbi:hypothetical protein [uncultured Mycolicibacterium sp.]|uniref:hypothetical protein n=1 Tax=uncultured Mycolicibacterium sp. TaxID=2320817 RepID=UPI002635A9B7|nr:hypothetical protein [uncultured Mycolicibacterium sp.]